MKYKDLLDFCSLMLATEADETVFADKHVLSGGYIEKVWERILIAIRKNEDFDFRAYLEQLVAEKHIPKKLLH
jgi:hypothetical protein